MTLIIAVATPNGVHMSSDFRLAIRGADGLGVKYADDLVGAKQFHHQAYGWQMRIAFTGLAEIGHLKLRDVIGGAIGSGTPQDAPETVEHRILGAINQALSHPSVYGLRDPDRRLTILMAVAKPRIQPELILLSTWERLDSPRALTPFRDLVVTRKHVARPAVYAYGYQEAIARGDRKLLGWLANTDAIPARIRDVLISVNASAASRSRGYVSSECMAESIDGILAFSSNPGQVKGVLTPFMSMFADVPDATEAVKRVLEDRYDSLDRVVLVHSASGSAAMARP